MKNNAWLWVVALVVVFAVRWQLASAQAPGDGQRKWEYNVISSDTPDGKHAISFTTALQSAGQKGWELVTVVYEPKEKGQPKFHLYFRKSAD